MDGDHDIDRCYEVTQRVLNKTFQELRIQRVALEGMILKPNMAISGKKSANKSSVEEVAEKTVRLLKSCVPAAVPGIAFLSGSQSDEDCHCASRRHEPDWRIAVEADLLLRPRAADGTAKSMVGQDPGRCRRTQVARRAQMNSLANKGEWKADLEQKKAAWSFMAPKPAPLRHVLQSRGRSDFPPGRLISSNEGT